MNTLFDGVSSTLRAVRKKEVGLEDRGTVLEVRARSTCAARHVRRCSATNVPADAHMRRQLRLGAGYR